MYRYRITVEPVPETPTADKLQFEVDNHDDIFAIVRRMSGRLELDDNATKALAVGLKLFCESVLQNRNQPLFQSIQPALGEFTRALKEQVRASQG